MPENDTAQHHFPLLLLPGFMLNEHLWDDIQDGLSELRTLHFGNITLDDSIAAMAERVLEHAPAEFTLVGFSMGGYVAQHVYRLAPHRVKALILMNTSAHQQTELEVARTQSQVELAKSVPFKGLTRRALAASVAPDRAGDQVLLGRLQTMALTNGKDVFIRQLSALRDDGYAHLDKVQCPTLVIASRHDQMRSVAESEQMADLIPNSKLVVFEEAGHMTPLEAPELVLQTLTEWLQDAP